MRAYEKAGFKRAGTLRRNKMMGGKLWDTILMDAVAEEFESLVLAHVLVSDDRRGGDETGVERTSWRPTDYIQRRANR